MIDRSSFIADSIAVGQKIRKGDIVKMKRRKSFFVILALGLVLTACGGNEDKQDLVSNELAEEPAISEEGTQEITQEATQEATQEITQEATGGVWSLEDFTVHAKDKEYLKATTEDYSIHEVAMPEGGGNLQQRWYSYDEQGTIVYACEKTVFDTETEAEELYQYQMQNYAEEMEGKLFQEGTILYRLHDMSLEVIINTTDKETEWEEYSLLSGKPEAEYEKYYFSIPWNGQQSESVTETSEILNDQPDTDTDTSGESEDPIVNTAALEDFEKHPGDAEHMKPVTEDYYFYQTTNLLDDMLLVQQIHSYDEEGNCCGDVIKTVYATEAAAKSKYEDPSYDGIRSNLFLDGAVLYNNYGNGCGSVKQDDFEQFLWWQKYGDDAEKEFFSKPIE